MLLHRFNINCRLNDEPNPPDDDDEEEGDGDDNIDDDDDKEEDEEPDKDDEDAEDEEEAFVILTMTSCALKRLSPDGSTYVTTVRGRQFEYDGLKSGWGFLIHTAKMAWTEFCRLYVDDGTLTVRLALEWE